MSPAFLTPFTLWLFLVASTGLTYLLGEFGSPGRLLIVGVLLIALFKGALVVLEFMELRHAPAFWRRVVLGWLTWVAVGIVFAYLK